MVKPIITDIKAAEQAGLLTSGRYFIDITTATPLFLPLWFGNKLDLDKMIVYTDKDIDAHPELKDYNDLVRTGRIAELTIYREHDMRVQLFSDYECRKRLNATDMKEIIAEFREHGFAVTPEAIGHNYSAWLGNLKSGYRDEENGYHLFTPCGWNPLSFRATSLDSRLDWQTTYVF